MKYCCNLCGSEDIEILLSPASQNIPKAEKVNSYPTSSDFGIFYPLAKCKNCHLIFSVFDKEQSAELYAESEDKLYLEQRDERRRTYKKILSNNIENFLSEKGRLLDIGCSYGLFLDLARDRGLEVYGIELSKDACKYCKESLQLNVFRGEINSINFPQNYFGIITAFEVIEHVTDAKGFIYRLYELLKPGGTLCLVTPNVESFSGRLLGYNWWSYRMMHNYYFSKKVLCDFLGKKGFNVLAVKPYRKTFKAGYVLDKLYKYSRNKKGHYLLSRLSNIWKIKNIYLTASFGDMIVICRKI